MGNLEKGPSFYMQTYAEKLEILNLKMTLEKNAFRIKQFVWKRHLNLKHLYTLDEILEDGLTRFSSR